MARKVEILLEAKEKAKAAVEAATKALKEQNEAVAYAKTLYTQTLSAEEKFAEGQRKISAAMVAGKISIEQNARAMQQLRKEYDATAARAGGLRGIFGGAGSAGGGGMALMGILRGVLPAVGAGVAARGSWKAFSEQETAEARLQAVLRATGGVSGQTMEGIRGFANDRQARTMFADEDTIGAASVLATFKHIKDQQFTQTLKAAQDLATIMGTDLQSAALKLGKAMEDPAEFMSTLARSGIVLSDSTQKQIKGLVELNDLTGAQERLLGELNARMGDAAEIAGSTASGAFEQLKNSLSDLGESIGGYLVPMMRSLSNTAKTLSGAHVGDVSPGISGRAKDLGLTPSGDKIKSAMKANRAALDDVMKRQLGLEAPAWWNPLAGGQSLAMVDESNALKTQADVLNREYAQLMLNLQRNRKQSAAQQGSVPALLRALGISGIDIMGTVKGAAGGLLGGADSLVGMAGAGIGKLEDTAEFSKQLAKFFSLGESPEQARDRRLKELEPFRRFLPQDRLSALDKDIEDDFLRATKPDTEKARAARDDRLAAMQSRFLTRGPGLMQSPELKVQQSMDKRLEKATGLLERMNTALQDRGDVVLENLV